MALPLSVSSQKTDNRKQVTGKFIKQCSKCSTNPNQADAHPDTKVLSATGLFQLLLARQLREMGQGHRSLTIFTTMAMAHVTGMSDENPR
ncbi:hypothetical protein T265_15977, partial [Opisthorchis viverrini]